MVATKRDKFVSVPKAAEFLEVSPKTMQTILASGEIEYMTPHVHRRVSMNSLKLYKARNTVGANVGIATVDGDPLRD